MQYIRKILLGLVLCISLFFHANAQKRVLVRNNSGRKSYAFFVGQNIQVQQKNSQKWDVLTIDDVQDKFIISGDIYIDFEDIKRVFIPTEKRKNNLLKQGPVIAGAGILYGVADGIDSWRQSEQFKINDQVLKTSAVMVVIGLVLPMLKPNVVKIGKRWHIGP